MLCRDVLWDHLQHVALVTESSKDDERKPRRAVKKIGIDPHFAFANMLCDVGWARAYGTSRMLSVDERPKYELLSQEKRRSPEMEQLMDALPGFAEYIHDQESEHVTCGDCANFDSETGRCTARFKTSVKVNLRTCSELFIARVSDDDDEDEDY